MQRQRILYKRNGAKNTNCVMNCFWKFRRSQKLKEIRNSELEKEMQTLFYKNTEINQKSITKFVHFI